MALRGPSNPDIVEFSAHQTYHGQAGIKATGSLTGRPHLGSLHLFENSSHALKGNKVLYMGIFFSI